MQEELLNLEGSHFLNDYFYTNTVNFSISSTEKIYGRFCVKPLNIVNLYIFLTLNVTDSVDIFLTKNGKIVATA